MTAQQPNSKSPAAVRMRRMRERRATGMIVIPACEIPPGVVEALCDLGWLGKDEMSDPVAIGDAVTDLVSVALDAGMRLPSGGSILITYNLEPEGVAALVSSRWLSVTPEQQRPWDVVNGLVDAAKAAIEDGLEGDK